MGSNKNASASKDRRKSGTTTAAPIPSSPPSKQSRIVVLKVTPKLLRAIVDPNYVKEDTPVPKEETTPPTAPVVPAVNGENASDSTPDTPAAGTPAPQPATMGPPVEGPKKKGPKRTAAALGANGEPKPRGKPGPKKKQRLEDGSIEPSGRAGLSAHKLGPKANQGAINAGLRALDRSGKPCRKWTRGGFTMKSFTGVVWEIPRWTAPPKIRPEASSASEADNSNPVSTGGDSSKENSTANLQVPNGTNGVNGVNGVNGTNGVKEDVVMNGTGASSQAKSEGASNTNEPVDADVTMVDVDLTTASAGPASVAAADSNAPTPAAVPIAAA